MYAVVSGHYQSNHLISSDFLTALFLKMTKAKTAQGPAAGLRRPVCHVVRLSVCTRLRVTVPADVRLH